MRCCSKECWRVVAIGVTILAAVLLTAIPLAEFFFYGSAANYPAEYITQKILVHIHLLLGGYCALFGPLQFSDRFRLRWPSLHRWVGRAYLIGELLSLCAAAALLPYEHAHPEHFGNAQVVVPVGLTLLATILTGFMGYIRIRQRQYLRHRVWMMRNYALLITLPLSIILYMLFYLVPVVLQWAEDYQVHVFYLVPLITALVAEFIVQCKYLQVTAGRGQTILNEEVPFLSMGTRSRRRSSSETRASVTPPLRPRNMQAEMQIVMGISTMHAEAMISTTITSVRCGSESVTLLSWLGSK